MLQVRRDNERDRKNPKIMGERERERGTEIPRKGGREVERKRKKKIA